MSTWSARMKTTQHGRNYFNNGLNIMPVFIIPGWLQSRGKTKRQIESQGILECINPTKGRDW